MTIMNGGLGGRGKNGREITNARTIDRREREANCSLHLQRLSGNMTTGLPAYSDSAWTTGKCHWKKSVTVTGIFSIRRSFYGLKHCHCSRNVTVTGVTVSGEACNMTT